MIKTITICILVITVSITVGWAARQLTELQDHNQKIYEETMNRIGR